MALVAANLQKVAHGGGNAVYVYASGADAVATVKTSGYFNGVSHNLALGDIIIVAPTGVTPVLALVTSASRAAVVTTV